MRVAIWAVCSTVGAGQRLGGLSASRTSGAIGLSWFKPGTGMSAAVDKLRYIHLTMLRDDNNQVSKKCHISLDETQIA